jgi:hypothetical protein
VLSLVPFFARAKKGTPGAGAEPPAHRCSESRVRRAIRFKAWIPAFAGMTTVLWASHPQVQVTDTETEPYGKNDAGE